MKAIVYTEYGPPSEVVQLQEVEKPSPEADQVLVKIRATSVCWADEAYIRGKPFLARLSNGLQKPQYTRPGMDIAGQVEAVGADVKGFQPGDEVFGDIGGCGYGAFAEYVAVPESVLAPKPANLTYAEAAAVPQYGLVALQGLRDAGGIQPGQKVLINGASGGIGPFAVQLAKHFGAEVTGVCGARSADLVRSLGADHVIDYAREDFTRSEPRYDLILDIVAKGSIFGPMRALSPEGTYVAVAFSAGAFILGSLLSAFGGKKLVQLSHEPNAEDLAYMRGLIEDGTVVPVVDSTYPLSEAGEAVRHYGEGHPQGKVVITVEHDARGGD